MRRPSVFVSSTCYDLGQVRTDMKHFIEEIGLDPVLSDQATFPVNPSLGTVDNCLNVVSEKSDIFVLIVGGRYGSITQNRNKSVTNLEFLAAKAKGVPIYVFVMRSILDILPVWMANPDADFSQVCDSSALFKFVAEIKDDDNLWMFSFDTAQDIFQVLRAQFAYLFMDALALKMKANKSSTDSQKFRHVSGTALRLIIERSPAWEYLLFGEALSHELEKLSDLKRDWRFDLAFGDGHRMGTREFFGWLQEKASGSLRMTANIQSVVDNVLPFAFGPAGASGDPEAILYAANRLATIYRNALEWKSSFLRVDLPAELHQLRSIGSSMCNNMIVEIEDFTHRVQEELARAVQLMDTGQPAVVRLTLNITVPDLSEMQLEMDRIGGLIQTGST